MIPGIALTGLIRKGQIVSMGLAYHQPGVQPAISEKVLVLAAGLS